MSSQDLGFIEVASSQLSEKGQCVSGDVFRKERYKGHTVMVLSDGAGSGIKANIVASVISSMVINYAKMNRSMAQVARAIFDVFARGSRSEDLTQATFSMVDITDSGRVLMMEFVNPKRVVLRGGKIYDIPRRREVITVGQGRSVDVYVTEFRMELGDRIVFFSDGVTLSGYATRRMPFGWRAKGVERRLEELVEESEGISASELCRKVILECEANDLFAVKNDMSCVSIYYRRPRRVLICSGPPYNKHSDGELVERLLSYDGTRVVCGGTTAQIVSRESGRDISVILKRDPSLLPPESRIEGLDMVTEGVLTLSKVKLLLQTLKGDEVVGRGLDSRFVKMLFSHDIIEFVVGTGVNTQHHDPSLPMELEMRRTIIRDIAAMLERRFMKQVRIDFI